MLAESGNGLIANGLDIRFRSVIIIAGQCLRIGGVPKIGDHLTDRFLKEREHRYTEIARPFLGDRAEPSRLAVPRCR